MNKLIGVILIVIATTLLAGCLAACSANDHQAKTIIVATEGTYSPYSYHDADGNLTGYDVELMRLVADDLDLDIEFVETGFDGMAAGLDSGRFDVLANQITITEARQEKYIFSEPYTYVRGVVITSTDNTDIDSFEDLDGKDVSLTITSNWAETAQSYGANIVATDGFSQSVMLVLSGAADATVNDNVAYLDYMKQHPDASLQIAAQSDDVNCSAFMFRTDEADLRNKMDESIARLRADGRIAELSRKYFGEDLSVQ